MKKILVAAAFSGAFVLGAYAQDDPPARVADLNYVSGNVSIQPAGADDWAPAVINRPVTTGDNLWTDAGARAELHVNNAAMRLNSQSSFGFLNLDDHTTQIRFSEGEMVVRVRRLGDDQTFEVDTPNAAVTILRDGEYRFQADPDNGVTSVVVRYGDAEVTGGGQAFAVHAGNGAQISGTDQVACDVQPAPAPDWLENWSQDRDAHEARSMSARYLPPDVIGYSDLDSYGSWRTTPDYGAVWYPNVAPGWAPYHYGHWAWIEPWGWSWVDDAPWGFAPSHYGRWAYMGGGWGWIPGPMVVAGGGVAVVRPVYAPALVAFIGGGNWGVGFSIGGPAVGWVPLGPGEMYAPAYRVSPGYFRTVNVSNTTVVNNVNITNVYNTVYVNNTVTNVNVNQRYVNMASPNAVTAMPQAGFASGRPVTEAGISVPRTAVANIASVPMTVAPRVAPTRQALAPVVSARPVVRPPASVVRVQVVAKVAPPPAAVPFAAKQAVLQQNIGRPVDMQAIRQAAPVRTVATVPVVRIAPAARPAVVTPQPGRTFGAPGAGTPAYRPPTAAPQAQPTPAYRSPTAQPTYRPPAEQAQPAQPAPRPPQSYERPPQPAARPYEAAPRPAPQSKPAPPPKPAEKPKKEEKSK